jgi:hypothetical protein
MARSRGGKPWTQDEDGRLTALWSSGLVGREIAFELGRSVPACWSRAKMLGLPPRAESPAVLAERAKMARAASIAAAQERANQTMNLDRSTAAWVAGVFDAHGTMGAYGRQPAKAALRMAVSSKRRALVAGLYLAIGHGATRQLHRARKTRVTWIYDLSGTLMVQTLLRSIAPLMRVRRPLADLLLQWPVNGPHTTMGRNEVAAKRVELYQAIAEFNAREDLRAE